MVDKVLDKTGMKGTGNWTVQQAADLSESAPTVGVSLDSRFLSGLIYERVAASKIFQGDCTSEVDVDKAQLIEDMKNPLCLEDLQLRTRHGHYQGQEHGERVGPEPW